MNNQTSRFLFKGFDYHPQEAKVDFHYEMQQNDERINFADTLLFPQAFSAISESNLKPLLNNLLLMFGISYWKLFCPKTIEIVSFTLTKEQADFWNKVYTKGLGEFFYQNKIDFRNLIHFPFEETAEQPVPIALSRQERSLVPIGGGKDGIVAAKLLQKSAKSFSTLLIYTGIERSTAQEDVAKELGESVIRIYHTLDPKLLELNKRQDTHNGHVPMVAMHAFIELLAAFVYDYRYIVLANEESANYGNVEYLGETMNHQWSKSLEFEEMFQNYVTKNITQNILYFSLLRPLSEIKIAQLFSHCPEYFSHFVSCNKGFSKVKEGKTYWCGQCPKCAFVFALLSAFLPKENVLSIFGKNLFEDASLLGLYRELLGLEAFKPFECVGTPEETQLALSYAWKKKEWNDTPVMKFFINEVLPTFNNKEETEKKLFSLAENRLPSEFLEILKQPKATSYTVAAQVQDDK